MVQLTANATLYYNACARVEHFYYITWPPYDIAERVTPNLKFENRTRGPLSVFTTCGHESVILGQSRARIVVVTSFRDVRRCAQSNAMRTMLDNRFGFKLVEEC